MLFALKLFLTPILTLMLTLAGRKWGQRVSGVLTGLPLNSGPISFLFALEYGTDFAAQAAVGSMGGMAAIAFFALVYAHLARRAAWYICAPFAIAAFFAVIAILQITAPTLLVTFIVTTATLVIIKRWMPHTENFVETIQPPKWDLPMRLITATVFVLLITALGEILGPRLGGLAATFPIFATVMSVFAHRHQGSAAAIQWLRGFLSGAFAAVAFYIVIGTIVIQVPLYVSYPLAIAAALGTNLFMLHWTRVPIQDPD